MSLCMFQYIYPFILLMHLVYSQDFMHKTKKILFGNYVLDILSNVQAD